MAYITISGQHTIRYDTIRYIYVRSKADKGQLSLAQKQKIKEKLKTKTD